MIRIEEIPVVAAHLADAHKAKSTQARNMGPEAVVRAASKPLNHLTLGFLRCCRAHR
jgi:hypothetical protein